MNAQDEKHVLDRLESETFEGKALFDNAQLTEARKRMTLGSARKQPDVWL